MTVVNMGTKTKAPLQTAVTKILKLLRIVTRWRQMPLNKRWWKGLYGENTSSRTKRSPMYQVMVWPQQNQLRYKEMQFGSSTRVTESD